MTINDWLDLFFLSLGAVSAWVVVLGLRGR